jgi:hypothetical protein
VNSLGHSPFLGACLIVKDEAARLPACLASLRTVVDEIVVYDTGSTDGTPEIAMAAGARVVLGTWPGSFAAARNHALDLSHATWVIAVDADEVVEADPMKLRELLRRSQEQVYAVRIDNIVAEDRTCDFQHHHTRLFRRVGSRWVGVVHEVLADDAGRIRTPCGVDPALLSIVHHGYSSQEVVRAKGARNALLVTEQVLAAAASPEPTSLDDLRPLLVHLIRSEEGSGRRREAIAVARSLHESLPVAHPGWEQVTDLLVQLSLSADRAAAAKPVLRRWRAHRPGSAWLDYLEAKILTATGDPVAARALFEGLPAHDLEDTVGVRVPAERVRQEHAGLARG